MKTLTLLKITTVVLALLLAGGTGLVAYKITDIRTKSKPLPVNREAFTLNFPENINTVLPCGDQICLMTIGHEKGHRLLIVNPNTGHVQSVITFRDKPTADIN